MESEGLTENGINQLHCHHAEWQLTTVKKCVNV